MPVLTFATSKASGGIVGTCEERNLPKTRQLIDGFGDVSTGAVFGKGSWLGS